MTTLEIEQRHRRLLRRFSIAARFFAYNLLILASFLPVFDSSPYLVPNVNGLELPLLRWDVFHFVNVANHSYVHEHEWAFFPGVSYLMRSWYLLQRLIGIPPANLLLVGMICAFVCDTSQLLYSLSLHHLRSPELAFLASLLSLLPTSPVTAYFAPYNESFFANFSYRGMLCCVRREWFKASLWFAVAGYFRSNGVFLSGFIIWGLLIQPSAIPPLRTIAETAALTSIIFTPFVGYHLYAYFLFCPHTEWCSYALPSIYSYAQSKYWNVGFLRYWTVSQLPNFLIAAPSLALIYTFSIYHIKSVLVSAITSLPRNGSASPNPLLRLLLIVLYKIKETSPTSKRPSFQGSSITPHAIHATILASILLFASHTQIVLRLAHSMPLIYWAAAWLHISHPKVARLWVIWSILWSAVSIILWATFLPPA